MTPGLNWTKEQYVAMNNRALARMLKCHPECVDSNVKQTLLKALGFERAQECHDQPGYRWGHTYPSYFCAVSFDAPAFENTEKPSMARPKMAQQIIREVLVAHGISYIDLISQRRQSRLVRARQEAMYRMHNETTLSYPVIGRLLGNRDHTTVIYGVRQHEARMAEAV